MNSMQIYHFSHFQRYTLYYMSISPLLYDDMSSVKIVDSQRFRIAESQTVTNLTIMKRNN